MQVDAVLEAARAAIAANTWCFAITLAADGAPHARLVQPGRLREDWSLRFLSDARSRKVRELCRDPRLALAWRHDAGRRHIPAGALGATERCAGTRAQSGRYVPRMREVP